jgi:hypothetical protein
VEFVADFLGGVNNLGDAGSNAVVSKGSSVNVEYLHIIIGWEDINFVVVVLKRIIVRLANIIGSESGIGGGVSFDSVGGQINGLETVVTIAANIPNVVVGIQSLIVKIIIGNGGTTGTRSLITKLFIKSIGS